MTVIVSTRSVRDKILANWPSGTSFEQWIVVDTIPVVKKEIISMLRRRGCIAENGRLLFLVNSKRRKPADFPGLFVDQWLLSLVFYKNDEDLFNWIQAIKTHAEKQPGKALVLGMMKPFYMKWAHKMYVCFQKEKHLNGNTYKHLPDTTTNLELAQKLSKGSALAVYVGHGRSRGWSGYRGFRWEHMEKTEQVAPVGVMFSFSCSGLKKDKLHTLPFGLRWITSGRACTSIASCESLQIRPLEVIANAFMESISKTNLKRIDEILFDMNNNLKAVNDPAVNLNWQNFRLIGNPLQSVK